MDFGKAYTFITDDPEWITKVAIGGLIVLITPLLLGIPALLLLGYQVEVTRRVMNDDPEPLPAWEDWGELFMDGLNIFLARLVYSAPASILLCLGLGVFLLPVLGGDQDAQAALASISFAVYCVLLCLVTFFALFVAFVTPAISIQYVRTRSLGEVFRFGEVFAIARAHASDILLVWLASVVANLLLQLVVGISVITICGPIILAAAGAVWITSANGHLYGQIGRRAGIPVKSPVGV